MKHERILYILFILVFKLAGAHIVGQQCDWTGSGLSGGEKRGVRPVYLRCGEGRVSWSYPEGALRVLLRLGSSGKEFRACLRPTPYRALPASIYLEGPRSLNKLYQPKEPEERPHVRCVQSRGGQVALYVESAVEPSGKKQIVEFVYDLQPMPKGSVYDPNDECRPCTKQEMTHAFCTNELVTRGMIQRVEQIEDTDVSELTVRITKVLRRWSPTWENEVTSDNEVIQVSRHCGVKHGAGEMVIMARRKLGQLVLTCAPRVSEWMQVVAEASLKDSAHCVLKS